MVGSRIIWRLLYSHVWHLDQDDLNFGLSHYCQLKNLHMAFPYGLALLMAWQPQESVTFSVAAEHEYPRKQGGSCIILDELALKFM